MSDKKDEFYSGNVEEAVMHIVGSTLADDPKKRKSHFDPFGVYAHGWDILDQNYPDFYPLQQVRKRKRVDTPIVDPQLSFAPPSAPGHHHPGHGVPGVPGVPGHGVQAHPGVPPHHTHTPIPHTPHTNVAPARQRIAWESDIGGVFDASEMQALENFKEQYCQQHKLTPQQFNERVWNSDRKKDSFWDAVTAVLPHRTRASVYKHVRRTYHVFKVRAKWMPDDDQRLRQLFTEKGPQWKQIGRIMGRMPEDCRDRYRNYVKCGEQRNENKWSPEEEQMLEQAVSLVRNLKDDKINWTAVSERMGGTRSRIQCRYKWRKLRQAGAA